MTPGTAARRHAERGIIRGCCLLVLLLTVLVAGVAYLGFRATSAPDLGAPPGGPSHGTSETVIAAALAGSAATQLVAGGHAVVVLSERDLTVLAAAHDPNPGRYRNPQARVRDGLAVVSAQTSLGPFGFTGVVHIQLTFSTDGGRAHITAQPLDYAVGQIGLPSWISDRVVPNGSSALDLSRLFNANPALELLAQAMECVAVQSDGVHVAFHRPGTAPDASRCSLVLPATAVP